MNPSRRLGILGGMFDPIHCGHLDTGAAAQGALDLTGLLVVPSNIPPHRPQPIATSFHRFAMVAMAIAGRSGWRALDLELNQATRSYTADTLRKLHAGGFLPVELFFIAGADAFLEIATWKDYPALLDLAHFAVVARPGVQVGELPARLPALASRMRTVHGPTRRLTADTTARLKPETTGDRPIGPDTRRDTTSEQSNGTGLERTLIFLIDAMTADVSSTAVRLARLDHRSIAGMVPPSVQQHIEQHALYEAPAPTAGGGAGLPSAEAGRLHGQV
jgi:nicotinate-nucleotide adenylyltransferase